MRKLVHRMVRAYSHPYVLYVIFTHDNDRLRTYIGITNNLPNRIRKHNGEITGGAKYTKRYSKSGCKWILGATAHHFANKTEALQAEWAVQNPTVSKVLKRRTVRAGNTFTRAVSDLFYYCAHAKDRSHLRPVLHTAPGHVQQELLHEGHVNYCLYPAELLLDKRYPEFLEKLGTLEITNIPQPPVPSPTPHISTRVRTIPKPDAHPRKPPPPPRNTHPQSRTDYLRSLATQFEQQSKELLAQATKTQQVPTHGRVVITID